MIETDLKSLTNEQLAEQYENLSIQEEEIVAGKVEIRQEVLLRMKRDQEIWGNYAVSKRKNYSFTLTVDQARELGAVKTEEKVDAIKMKKLYLAGAKIPGEVIVKETTLIRNVTENLQEQVNE